MKSANRDKKLLLEILKELKIIDRRVAKGKGAFDASDELQDAVTMRLITLGELLGGLSDAFYELHPEIPAARVRGLLSVLAHEYGNVDFGRLWNILDKDYAGLSASLRKIANE